MPHNIQTDKALGTGEKKFHKKAPMPPLAMVTFQLAESTYHQRRRELPPFDIVEFIPAESLTSED